MVFGSQCARYGPRIICSMLVYLRLSSFSLDRLLKIIYIDLFLQAVQFCLFPHCQILYGRIGDILSQTRPMTSSYAPAMSSSLTEDSDEMPDLGWSSDEECHQNVVPMEVYAHGEVNVLCRPCVDCGRKTGCFCDYCKAADRMPGEMWAQGQMTPLCDVCDNTKGCHFCRRQAWCVPPVRE